MPLVTEFEQLPEKPAGPVADQDPEDQKVVKKIEELFRRSKRHRRRFDALWHYNYEFVCSGRQWTTERPRWRFSEVINISWATIMTEIAIQTDSRPKFEFESQEVSDQAFADTLKEINARNWDKYKWSEVVAGGLFDCKLYHVAHGEVTWDPELEDGLGDVSFKMLDPFHCYWDPRASDVNKGRRCRYFIYAEPVPTSELKMKFPELKDKIKSDISLMGQKSDWATQYTGRISIGFDPYSPTRLPSTAAAQDDLYGGEPHTVFLRCWMRDDTMEEITEEKENQETGEVEKEFVKRLKYPRGRYIEIANQLVLRDCNPGIEINGEWVEFEHDMFPIARLVNYSYPREYAGENEVTHIKGPQKIINYVWSYILDCFKIQGNPMTILGSGSGVDEEEVTSEPGAIVHALDVNQVVRLPGTPVTPNSFELMKQAENMMDKIQGLQDVQRGSDLSNVNSALMLEGYLEAAQTRPRMKNRNLDGFLQDTGELMLRMIFQFYTQPRIFRVTNKQGFPEFIEMYMPTLEVKDIDGQTKMVKHAKMRRYSTNPDGSQNVIQNHQVEVKGFPDVRVTAGSALPYAKAQKSQQAMQMFNAHAIDQEEYLKAIDWPNYETVLKRMQEQAAQAQAAEAQQKAAK